MDFVNSSEVDVAYHVLTQAGQTMYYKDLVLDVIDKKRKPVQSLSASAGSSSKAAAKASSTRKKKLESIQE